MSFLMKQIREAYLQAKWRWELFYEFQIMSADVLN